MELVLRPRSWRLARLRVDPDAIDPNAMEMVEVPIGCEQGHPRDSGGGGDPDIILAHPSAHLEAFVVELAVGIKDLAIVDVNPDQLVEEPLEGGDLGRAPSELSG